MPAIAAATAAFRRAYACKATADESPEPTLTAMNLADACASTAAPYSQGMCHSYLRTVFDSLSGHLCVPAEITLADLARVYRGWVAEGGDRPAMQPSAAAQTAFLRAFRCDVKP